MIIKAFYVTILHNSHALFRLFMVPHSRRLNLTQVLSISKCVCDFWQYIYAFMYQNVYDIYEYICVCVFIFVCLGHCLCFFVVCAIYAMYHYIYSDYKKYTHSIIGKWLTRCSKSFGFFIVHPYVASFSNFVLQINRVNLSEMKIEFVIAHYFLSLFGLIIACVLVAKRQRAD